MGDVTRTKTLCWAAAASAGLTLLLSGAVGAGDAPQALDSCASSTIVETRPSFVPEPLSWVAAVQTCDTQAQGSAASPLASSADAGAASIDTVAGGGIGDGGPGPSAELFLPAYDVFDSAGNLYVSVQGRVVKIDPSGVPTTFAGTGTISFRPTADYYGDGRPATQANFGNGGPAGLAFDTQGNLYVADMGNDVIRKVDTHGIVSTVAGGGQPGHYGIEGDDPRNVFLWAPDGIAVDRAGNLYIADSGNCTVREVKASDGKIYTVAGIPPEVNPAQFLTCTYTADGVPALGSGLFQPKDVKVDANGNLFIADIGNNRIRMVDTNGLIHTVAGNGSATDSGDGGLATQAGIAYPWHIALDGTGVLYAVEYFGQKVRKIDASGRISTFAGTGAEGFSGDGGPATQATLEYPLGVAVDPSGTNVVIADFGNNRVRRVDGAGTIRTLAGNGLPPRVCTSPGVCAYYGVGYAGDGLAARFATLNNAVGVARDPSGNLFIADTGNNRIRKVDAATGIIRTIAGTGEPGSSGDGGPATSARITSPTALTVDSHGRLFVGQSGVIRMVDTSGLISKFAGNGAVGFSGDGGPATAAGISYVTGLAFDTGGDLYLSDLANNRVRRIDTRGIITTVAGNGTRGFSGDGGSATAAKLNSPLGLAVDAAGNLYIADTGNGRIRKVDTNGIITTVAGNGASGYDGDGGPATATALTFPMGVAVDGGGDVFVSDRGNCLVRRVDAATGSIHVVAGIPLSYTTASPGFLNCDFTGDGGPGTNAYMFVPSGLWLDPDGTLYFADTVNNRIRALRGLDVSPTASMTAPTDAFQTATTFSVAWQGRDPGGSVASYAVRYRQSPWDGAFGPYQTWQSNTTATQVSFTGMPGATYCFSVQAKDDSGKLSLWSPDACTAVPLDDRSLVRSGSWTAVSGGSFYLATALSSKRDGAALTTAGQAGVKRIAFVAETCKGCGSVNVYLGSTFLGTLSLNAASTHYRVLLPVGTFPSLQTGALRVVVAKAGKGIVIDGLALSAA
jgi:sugar lactone lactonase YvrE